MVMSTTQKSKTGVAKTAKTSPYFQSPSSKLSTTTQKSSFHFLKSPSSTLGSLENLGPLIYTWSELHPTGFVCTRNTGCIRETTICPPCELILQDATRHFSSCPIFHQAFDLGVLTKNNRHETCVELAGAFAEKCVRHLCNNRCYLRAFAASRDWVALRKTLIEITDQPLEELLQNWTCKLTSDNSRIVDQVDDESSNESGAHFESTNLRKSQTEYSGSHPQSLETTGALPRTVYLSPEKKRFSNQRQVLREFGLDSATNGDDEQWVIGTRSVGSGLPKRCTWVPSPRRLWNTQRWTLDSGDNLSSPLGLLEELFGDDPWRLLLSTIFLNRTQRVQVDVVMHSFLQQWPTAESVAAANVNEISTVIAPMGIRNRRARGIVQFSKDYLELLKSKVNQEETMKASKEASFHLSEDEIKRFYNCGQYVADAYRIFIHRDWTTNSTDHALEAYVEWKRGLRSLKGTTSRLSSAT